MGARSTTMNQAPPAGRQEGARGGFGRSVVLPVVSLWWREIVRFYRQRGRVVGVILSPMVFWLVIGSGFGSSVRYAGGGAEHYLE